MNETQKKGLDRSSSRIASGVGGTSFPHADDGIASNSALQSNAQVQGAGGQNWTCEKEMALPVLAEMGDIAPALQVLLRLQAEYARGEPGVSRAMRDVAYNAVGTEIERYLQHASRQFTRTSAE